MTAKYRIKDTFIITGRGLVLAGTIEEGIVTPGAYIEFDALEKRRKKRITAVSSMRKEDDVEMNVGLLIECDDETEIQELRRWRPKNELAIVSKE